MLVLEINKILNWCQITTEQAHIYLSNKTDRWEVMFPFQEKVA